MHCGFNVKHDDVVNEVISMIVIYPLSTWICTYLIYLYSLNLYAST